MVALVDQQLRKRVAVQFDAPAAGRIVAHEDVGHDGLHRLRSERGAGTRGERLQLRNHVLQVVVVDAADLLQTRQVAPRQQVQVLDQGRHGRVETVHLFQLQRQAFGDAARQDARRLEAVTGLKHAFDRALAATQSLGDFNERRAQIAAFVHAVDQRQRDRVFRRGEPRHGGLFREMFRQRLFALADAFEHIAVEIHRSALARATPVGHRLVGGRVLFGGAVGGLVGRRGVGIEVV